MPGNGLTVQVRYDKKKCEKVVGKLLMQYVCREGACLWGLGKAKQKRHLSLTAKVLRGF